MRASKRPPWRLVPYPDYLLSICRLSYNMALLTIVRLMSLAPSLARWSQAALNTFEFRLREFNTGSFPKGLSVMLGMMSQWIYDRDPVQGV